MRAANGHRMGERYENKTQIWETMETAIGKSKSKTVKEHTSENETVLPLAMAIGSRIEMAIERSKSKTYGFNKRNGWKV